MGGLGAGKIIIGLENIFNFLTSLSLHRVETNIRRMNQSRGGQKHGKRCSGVIIVNWGALPFTTIMSFNANGKWGAQPKKYDNVVQ